MNAMLVLVLLIGLLLLGSVAAEAHPLLAQTPVDVAADVAITNDLFQTAQLGILAGVLLFLVLQMWSRVKDQQDRQVEQLQRMVDTLMQAVMYQSGVKLPGLVEPSRIKVGISPDASPGIG